MGTSNYANTNTTKLFTIPDTEDWGRDIEDINTMLKEELDKLPSTTYVPTDTVSVVSSQSYPAKAVGYVDKHIHIKGLHDTITIKIIIKTVAGYYEGVVLDYDVEVSTGKFVTDYTTGVVDEIFDNPHDYISSETEEEIYGDGYIDDDFEVGLNKVMEDIGQGNVQRLLDKSFNELVEQIEAIFARYTIKMVAGTTFSNGETICQVCEE